MVSNGYLEVPFGSVLLEIEVADFMLKGKLHSKKIAYWILFPSTEYCKFRRHTSQLNISFPTNAT